MYSVWFTFEDKPIQCGTKKTISTYVRAAKHVIPFYLFLSAADEFWVWGAEPAREDGGGGGQAQPECP